MSLNDTPSSERPHIVFFGMRNAGKSSLVNKITNQSLSIVSPQKGTTTDSVRKAMEILPLGPVVIVDTPGLDDEGELGDARIKAARRELEGCDIAVIVVDGTVGATPMDLELKAEIKGRKLPLLIVFNKADASGFLDEGDKSSRGDPKAAGQVSESGGSITPDIIVSAVTGEGVEELKERLASLVRDRRDKSPLASDLLRPGEVAVLVVPIDESAPKARLILPQQMVMRDLLDANLTFMTCQPRELSGVMESLRKPPALVITDSQVFKEVDAILPRSIPLTSFSILLARFRGDLKPLLEGAERISSLKDGSRVLISEACTHHRQCNDIGSVKIPAWIEQKTGVKPVYEYTNGREFPDDLEDFELIIHCGGCMINEAEMQSRIRKAVDKNIPIVNYGMAIASFHGILERSLEVFNKTN